MLKAPLEIDGEDLVPLLFLHSYEDVVSGDPRVVDQDVDRPQLLFKLVDDHFDACCFADITSVTLVPPTFERGRSSLGRLPVPGHDGHFGAGAPEFPCDRQPNTAGASRDQRDLPVEFFHR